MEEIVNGADGSELIEQARIRREKLKKLSEEGNNPYLKTKYSVTATSGKVKCDFSESEVK